MEINTGRGFFGKIAAIAALVAAPKLSAQQPPLQPLRPRRTKPSASACLEWMRLAEAATYRTVSIISPAPVPTTAILKTTTSS